MEKSNPFYDAGELKLPERYVFNLDKLNHIPDYQPQCILRNLTFPVHNNPR